MFIVYAWWILITCIALVIELTAIVRREKIDRQQLFEIRRVLLVLMLLPIVVIAILMLIALPFTLRDG